MLEAKPQKRMHEESEASGELWMGVAPDMPNKGYFAEFVTSQVKVTKFSSEFFVSFVFDTCSF